MCVYGLSVIDRFLRLKNLLLDKHACTLEYDLESEVFPPESRLDSDRDCAQLKICLGSRLPWM